MDILIKNAKVVDGTGVPAYAADIAVTGGRISQIGQITDLHRLQPAIEVLERPVKGPPRAGELKIDPSQQVHVLRAVGCGRGPAVSGELHCNPLHNTLMAPLGIKDAHIRMTVGIDDAGHHHAAGGVVMSLWRKW